jgi:hypothetical protein
MKEKKKKKKREDRRPKKINKKFIHVTIVTCIVNPKSILQDWLEAIFL